MILSETSRSAMRKSVLLLLLMAVPTLASSQDSQNKKVPKLPVTPPKISVAPPKLPNSATQNGSKQIPPMKAGGPGSTKVGGPEPTKVSGPGSTKVGGPGSTKVEGGPGRPTTPGHEMLLRSGGSAHVGPQGQIRSIDKNGLHIERNLHGGRTIVSERNGTRVVTTGSHGGYVQRIYVNRGGHDYYQRTYYDHGVYRVGVYRGYYFGGRTYYGYYPAYYYHPGFYVWAYNPWPGPVYWGWGWAGAPWYAYYGFTPYPYYAGPAFWLTDYVIAANLQAAYANAVAVGAPDSSASGNQAGTDAAAASASTGDQVTLTPEVKQAIAEEVKAQLQAEQAAAGQGGQGASAPAGSEVPPALDPARTTFVVDTDLAVVADGQECSLTGGDVLTRISNTPDRDQKVNTIVTSSKKKDCAAGKQVAVRVDDLQEMQNHFREKLEEGMKEMAAKQGTGGMPKAPDTSTVASNVPPPAPDKSAAKALADQQGTADQTETQVKQETAGSMAGGGQ